VRTFAGPIVKVTVTKVMEGIFMGTVGTDDNRRLFMAGVPECSNSYVSIFHDHNLVNKEDYENEDKSKWFVRDDKKLKKVANNSVPHRNRD